MILKQYYLSCLAQASYLIGDEATRTAIVVDPRRDVDEYLRDAAALGLEIRDVFLTHFHADFVAGHLELRDRVGCAIHLGARATAEYEFVAAHDGDTLDRGALRLRVLETPGHTPESTCLLVFDLARSEDEPFAVLTGDTLFLGDVGRPDLLASGGTSAEDLAGMLYDSLREKLMPLPDATLVYPGHGAGSACGKNLSTDTVSTIGEQRRYNHALQPMSRGEFVRLVTADLPPAPPYFGHDALLNRQEHPTLDRVLEQELRPLALDDVLELGRAGAQLLDVRDAADFAGAHLDGAVNVGLGGKFATWAGTVLDRERPVVIVSDPGRELEAVTRLARIGLDRVAGYLDGGMGSVAARSDLVRRGERVTAMTLAEQLAGDEPPLVVDVRGPAEVAAERIAGSIALPLNQLVERRGELPKDRRIAVHCATGYRSSIAVSLLEASGVRGLSDLIGGIAAWKAAGLSVVAASGQ